MSPEKLLPWLILASCLWATASVSARAGVVNPDRTPEKAVKDSAKRSAGAEEKASVEKRRDDDGPKDAI